MEGVSRVQLTKACDTCVRAKRKCDQLLPSCSRCTRSGRSCSYKNEPLSSNGHNVLARRDSRAWKRDWPGLLVLNLEETSEANGLDGTDWPSSDRSSLSALEVTPRISLTLLQPADLEKHLSTDDLSFDYLVRQLRSFPALFVRSGKTPFIHPQLTASSSSIGIATVQKTCKNVLQRNKRVSYVVLDAAFSNILAVAKSVHTFTQCLHIVQSLVLIQAMSFFTSQERPEEFVHGDARQAVLDRWTHQLWSIAPSEVPSSYNQWEAYIFAESVRRTIHMSNKLRCIWDVWSKGYYVPTLFAEALPLDKRTYLWDVDCEQTALAQTTWQQSELLSYRELRDCWDVDNFAVQGLLETMLLVGAKGKTVVEQRLGRILSDF